MIFNLDIRLKPTIKCGAISMISGPKAKLSLKRGTSGGISMIWTVLLRSIFLKIY